MKPISSFTLTLLLLLVTFLWLPVSIYGAMSTDGPQLGQTKKQVGIAPKANEKHTNQAVFKDFCKTRLWKKKLKSHPGLEGEKASTLAKAALYLFLGSTALSLIISLTVAMVSTIIPAIISIAFLASIVLAFIVLFGDENKKSRAIAKTILIIAGIYVLISLLVLFAVLLLFAAAI
ncbi:MAG: hypothetical protein K9J37_22980 [Saprospiraceae bacterium]|nr:hypothetical protein [Saprospiraceae bacterium]MCF8252791.1 hypothetical protein [Saprospiraceae bacterium]MCF8283217.1 hypothetical protein [Bacteroidales bacterium]MCF8314346.1 hypothetical protein [Saprospiraceae bacterium]MCF8443220.1 hypothetical protein [Saprospiraceae bacterium]